MYQLAILKQFLMIYQVINSIMDGLSFRITSGHRDDAGAIHSYSLCNCLKDSKRQRLQAWMYWRIKLGDITHEAWIHCGPRRRHVFHYIAPFSKASREKNRACYILHQRRAHELFLSAVAQHACANHGRPNWDQEFSVPQDWIQWLV